MRRATLTTALVIAVLALANNPAWAGAPCERVRGNGLTSAVGPDQFAGRADDLTIGGMPWPATVNTYLLEQTITPDGTIVAVTQHFYELDPSNGDGICDEDEDCFETLDHAVLDPSETIPGLFRLNSVNRIVGGSGDFAAASGRLTSHGWIDFLADPPTAVYRTKGRICAD